MRPHASNPTPSGGAAVALDWGDEDLEGDEAPPTYRVPEGNDSPMIAPASDSTKLSYDDRAGHDLIVIGHGEIVKQDHGSLVAPEAVLAPADVLSLGQAVRDQRRCCSGLPEVILVARDDPTSFDEELFDADPVYIEVDDDHVYARADVLMTSAGVAPTEYLKWLRPATERHGCSVKVRLTDQYGQSESDFHEPWLQEDEPERYAEYLASRRAPVSLIDAPVPAIPDACRGRRGRGAGALADPRLGPK